MLDAPLCTTCGQLYASATRRDYNYSRRMKRQRIIYCVLESSIISSGLDERFYFKASGQ